MAIEVTPLDLWAPDGNERVKDGENAIAHNARTTQNLIAANQARIGIAEAKINAGAGGPGLSEDPDRPGLYYFAGTSFAADPEHPGLYNFEEDLP